MTWRKVLEVWLAAVTLRSVRLEGEEVGLEIEEREEFRVVVAWAKCLSLDCPDLQFPTKACSREMARPTVGLWRSVKTLARYRVGRKAVVWKF